MEISLTVEELTVDSETGLWSVGTMQSAQASQKEEAELES